MWQKIDPRWFRVWITKPWLNEWIAKTKSQSADFFVEDVKINKFVDNYFKRAGIWKVVIRKTDRDWEVIIFTSKPAVVIWKQWANLEKFQQALKKKFNKDFKVNVKEIKNPELSAKIVSELASEQIEKRMPFRRVGKSIVQKVMDKGALWVKFYIAWRLGWSDIARSESLIKWRVPLQTLKADIDYHYTTAVTKYWVLWIKIWIYKWDIYNKTNTSNQFAFAKQS